MKINKSQLREIIKQQIKEAAKEGVFQGYARNSFKRMIATASSGGNDNSPPFTGKPGKIGKSGPIVESANKIKSALNQELKKENPKSVNKAKDSIDDAFKQIGWEMNKATPEAAALNKLLVDEENLNPQEKSILQKAMENWHFPVALTIAILFGKTGISIASTLYLMAAFFNIPSAAERAEMYEKQQD
jgi:hypothetical protein